MHGSTGYTLEDGSHTIFLSTKGENDSEVPEELVRFLKYVAADLDKSLDDFEDDYVRQLQESVVGIKKTEEWRADICCLKRC